VRWPPVDRPLTGFRSFSRARHNYPALPPIVRTLLAPVVSPGVGLREVFVVADELPNYWGLLVVLSSRQLPAAVAVFGVSRSRTPRVEMILDGCPERRSLENPDCSQRLESDAASDTRCIRTRVMGGSSGFLRGFNYEA